MDYDVIIVGGGLAGLTAAVCLAKEGLEVLVLEKKPYPNHKVCGEYVSNEVRPFLYHLGLDIDSLGAVAINQFGMSNVKGKKITTQLPLGGFGLSRYTLDHALYLLAKKKGASITFEQVISVDFQNEAFVVRTKSKRYNSRIVLGAFGKRSTLDKAMQRPFLTKKSPWLGVKGHYINKDFPDNEVNLHCFPGGYGGLSKTENGQVNFCYLVHYGTFQKYKNIRHFNKEVVSKNPYLKDFLEKSTAVFDKPLSIAQFSFAKKNPVEDHVLMCGDSAGLIHPLCGNGMAMAIHGAKIASEGVLRFFNEPSYSREQLENDYTMAWNQNFKSRLAFGRNIQNLLMRPQLVDALFYMAPKTESFLHGIIKRTHGKPILV